MIRPSPFRRRTETALSHQVKSLTIPHRKIYEEKEDALGRHVCFQDGIHVPCPKGKGKETPPSKQQDQKRQLMAKLDSYPTGDLKIAVERMKLPVSDDKQELIDTLAESLSGQSPPQEAPSEETQEVPEENNVDKLTALIAEFGDANLGPEDKEELLLEFAKYPTQDLQQSLQGTQGQQPNAPEGKRNGDSTGLISREASEEERAILSQEHDLPEDADYPSFVIGFVQRVKSSPFHRRKGLFSSLYEHKALGDRKLPVPKAPPSPLANKPLPASQVKPSRIKPPEQPVEKEEQLSPAYVEQAPPLVEQPAESPAVDRMKEVANEPLPAQEPIAEEPKVSEKPQASKTSSFEESPAIEDLLGPAGLATQFNPQDIQQIQRSFNKEDQSTAAHIVYPQDMLDQKMVDKLLQEGFITKSPFGDSSYTLTLKGMLVKNGGHVPLPNTYKNVEELGNLYNMATPQQRAFFAKHYGLDYAPKHKSNFIGLLSEKIHAEKNPDLLQDVKSFQDSPEGKQIEQSILEQDANQGQIQQNFEVAQKEFKQHIHNTQDRNVSHEQWMQVLRQKEMQQKQAEQTLRNVNVNMVKNALASIVGEQPEYKSTMGASVAKSYNSISLPEAIKNAENWLSATTVAVNGRRPEVTMESTDRKDAGGLYSQEKKSIYIRNVKPMVVVHEYGHALEHQFPEIGAASRAFVGHRTAGETPMLFSNVSPDVEWAKDDDMGRKDDFEKAFGPLSPDNLAPLYVGKIYDNATEVLSMGLELMYENPLHFLKEDPEYFYFVVGIMTGKIKGKALPHE